MNRHFRKAKDAFSHWWAWIPVGLIIAGCTIYMAARCTSYALQRNEDLRSPQYAVESVASAGISFGAASPHTADEGVIKILSNAKTATESSQTEAPAARSNVIDDPEKIWAEDNVVTYNSYTIPEQVQQEDGSLGVLTIPKLGLSVNIFEAESEIEAMTHGIAHFKHTTSWDGNIGLCGHNVNYDLTDGYFKYLHTLKKGNEVKVKTSLGERTYIVETIKEIPETDWSWLNRTSDNRVTMITCITGKPSSRLMIQAVEKK